MNYDKLEEYFNYLDDDMKAQFYKLLLLCVEMKQKNDECKLDIKEDELLH